MTDAIACAQMVPARGHWSHSARLREATTQAWHSAMGTSAKPATAIFDFRDGIRLSCCAAAQAASGAKAALFSDVPFSVPIGPERRSTVSDVPFSLSTTPRQELDMVSPELPQVEEHERIIGQLGLEESPVALASAALRTEHESTP